MVLSARNAAAAIGRIGPEEEAIPFLIRLLDRPDPEIKQAAADALYKVGPWAAPAVPRLNKLLEDGDMRVRRSSADTLGEIGRTANPVVPHLIRIYLQEEDEQVRRSAAVALGKLRLADETAHQALIKDLKHPSPELREAAAVALWETWPEQSLIPAFTLLLDDPEWGVRRAAIDGLGHIGRPDTKAIGKLRDLLKDTAAWEVRRSAAVALARMRSNEASADLVLALTDRHWEVGRTAAYALLQIGPGPEAVPRLLETLADRNWEVRRASSDALAKIVPPPMVELIERLGDASTHVRAGATDALRQLNATAYPALPALAHRVASETDVECREKDVEAVRAICLPLPADGDTIAMKELRLRLGKVEEAERILEGSGCTRPGRP